MSTPSCFSYARKYMLVACGLLLSTITAGEVGAGILQLTISEGPVSYVILDDGPLDTLAAPPPDNTNKIQSLAAALVFLDYKVVGLNASTNAPGDPGLGGTTLTVGGEIQRITSGAAQPLIISVTDTDYIAPSAARFLQSSTSSTFTSASASNTRTFTSWYNPTNVPYATDDVQGLPIPLSHSSTGVVVNSHGDTATPKAVPPAVMYGLTNITQIDLSGAGADVVFGGSTQVTSIPEPTSVALITLGLPVVLLALRRKRPV
jgi:hypothetical protein